MPVTMSMVEAMASSRAAAHERAEMNLRYLAELPFSAHERLRRGMDCGSLVVSESVEFRNAVFMNAMLAKTNTRAWRRNEGAGRWVESRVIGDGMGGWCWREQ